MNRRAPPFYMWLRAQRERADCVGEIARSVSRDPCLASTDYEGIRRHLQHEHHANPNALRPLDAARDEHLSESQ